MFISCYTPNSSSQAGEMKKEGAADPASPSPWKRRRRITRRSSPSVCFSYHAPPFQHILLPLSLSCPPPLPDPDPSLHLLGEEEVGAPLSPSPAEEKQTEDRAALLVFALFLFPFPSFPLFCSFPSYSPCYPPSGCLYCCLVALTGRLLCLFISFPPPRTFRIASAVSPFTLRSTAKNPRRPQPRG